MSDETVQTIEEVVNVFYPDEESEPLEAPTEEASKDETPEETEDESTEVVDETEEETEEAESSEEEADEVEDVQTIKLDGVEHNLTDIQEWKEAHDNVKLMQADCTKKWQEASDLKKEADVKVNKAQDLAEQLEVLIAEDSEINLESYKDIDSDNYDPDEYIRLKDKIDKRKVKMEELKANRPKSLTVLTQDELVAESNDFYAYDPKWKDEKGTTKAFDDDMKVAGKYLSDRGYSQEEINDITYSHHWKTIIDASKYDAQQKKVTSIKKKVLKTPKATKPKAQTKSKTAEDIFYG